MHMCNQLSKGRQTVPISGDGPVLTQLNAMQYTLRSRYPPVVHMNVQGGQSLTQRYNVPSPEGRQSVEHDKDRLRILAFLSV